MKVYEGAILTCDANDQVARYLVEDGGRILYVGDELPERYISVRHERLGKKALIPAFTDSHIHFASFSTFHAGLNVMNAASNEEILSMLSAFAKKSDQKMLIGFGASPYSVKERRLVNRNELDRVCPDKPVFMVKYDGHACVVNTKLYEQVKDKVSGLRGCHVDTGEMNQEAFFAISDYVTNSISVPQLLKNMQKAIDYMASKGIGMIHTVSGVGFVRDLDVDLERWFGRGLNNGMQLRVFFQTMDVKKVQKRHLPRVGGCFATALDGRFLLHLGGPRQRVAHRHLRQPAAAPPDARLPHAGQRRPFDARPLGKRPPGRGEAHLPLPGECRRDVQFVALLRNFGPAPLCRTDPAGSTRYGPRIRRGQTHAQVPRQLHPDLSRRDPAHVAPAGVHRRQQFQILIPNE